MVDLKKTFFKTNGLFSIKAMKMITGRIATETRQIFLFDIYGCRKANKILTHKRK